MKTNTNKNRNEGAQSRPEQVSTGTKTSDNTTFFNFRERYHNLNQPADYILASLARWMPKQHKLAKVARGVITIQFPYAPMYQVTRELSELGFWWNAKRNAWQHYGGKGNV